MKLWGGRFEKKTDGLVDDFHSSITFDKRLIIRISPDRLRTRRCLASRGSFPKPMRTRLSKD